MLPIQLTLGNNSINDELQIYLKVRGILLSWKASMELQFLPKCYPQLVELPRTESLTVKGKQAQPNPSTSDDLLSEFPSVFDGHIIPVESESFHISLTANAKPFCIKTHRTIPFSYRDKLKAELQTLQEQGIITPVTYLTDWCAPIVVTPKKVLTTSACVWTYHTSTDT